ncbi:MAG: hypothetical protein ACRYFU_14835 [Janthinobacterium lividum]
MTVTEMMPPEVRRIRAYFAPVNRAAQQPTLFDPAQSGSFALQAPPSPWVNLGWIHGFARASGTVVAPVRSGAPATTQTQVRSDIEATVHFSFESWSKLQLSLAAGTQQMNLLVAAAGAAGAGSGGTAATATALAAGSTATTLNMGAGAATAFPIGGLVVVDVDYTAGQTGFLGSGVSGAYLRTAVTDVDYVRRISLNTGRVVSASNGVLTLESPLLAGVPTAAMKVSAVAGFCDREGSSFFQEWSALFVGEGQQGERVLWHYPRLQSMSGIAEASAAEAGGYEALRLAGAFRALAVVDPVDGENVVCFRSYVTG